MRTILEENEEQQVQSDENGNEYVYRKDFVAGGDMKQEFSLSLVYSRKGRFPNDGSTRSTLRQSSGTTSSGITGSPTGGGSVT